MTSGKSYIRLTTQSLLKVFNAGKLTIFLCKFLALPAVLVIFSSYITFVTALITLCLE